MSLDYAACCHVARLAAAAAAEAIAPHFRAGVDVRYKADDSPVTVADEAAEAAIRAVLQAHYPEHGIYGEEGGASGLTREWLWLVDPIDGTKAFVRGDSLFSTQIALMHRGELVVGVSAAMFWGESAWAWRGGGAWLARTGTPQQIVEAPGERLKVATTGRLERAILSCGNIQTLAADAAAWARLGVLLQRVHRHRGYGDFLHYHRLAQGLIDAVLESDLNILDVAALAVIVQEAGGRMTALDGTPLALDSRSVLASTPALYAQFRQALEPA